MMSYRNQLLEDVLQAKGAPGDRTLLSDINNVFVTVTRESSTAAVLQLDFSVSILDSTAEILNRPYIKSYELNGSSIKLKLRLHGAQIADIASLPQQVLHFQLHQRGRLELCGYSVKRNTDDIGFAVLFSSEIERQIAKELCFSVGIAAEEDPKHALALRILRKGTQPCPLSFVPNLRMQIQRVRAGIRVACDEAWKQMQRSLPK